jgi:hypothetical protein
MARQPFRSFQAIMSQQKWHMMAAVATSLASFTPIMQEYNISWLI